MNPQPIEVESTALIPILQARLSDAELRAAMWQARAQQVEAQLAEQHNETELHETAPSASEGAKA